MIKANNEILEIKGSKDTVLAELGTIFSALKDVSVAKEEISTLLDFAYADDRDAVLEDMRCRLVKMFGEERVAEIDREIDERCKK